MTDYDAVAESYARMNAESTHNAFYERPVMLSLVGDVSGLGVLDAGCGSGPLSRKLASRGARRVLGLDLSGGMSDLALGHPEHTPDTEFRVASAGKWMPGSGIGYGRSRRSSSSG